MKKIYVLLLFFVGFGCSSHQVVLNRDTLVKGQKVQITLNNGNKVNGTVRKIDDENLYITDKTDKTWKANKSGISLVKGPEPVFDNQKRLVTEDEISEAKKSSNTKLYLISGSALSLGASFFLSSMVSRNADEDSKDAIIYSGSAIGTLFGGYFFTKMGMKKDREKAINDIISARASDPSHGLSEEKLKRLEVDEEIKRLKEERMRQNAELEALKKQIEAKKKKEKPE